MQTDFLDKILILLMVLILPVGIYTASKYAGQLDEPKEEQVQIAEEKLNEAVAKIQEAAVPQQEEPKIAPIEIADVSYASESGELIVSGAAPAANLNVMVSAVVTPSTYNTKTKNKDGSGESVLGEQVEVHAVKTDSVGHFTYKRKVDVKDIDLIELRFEQSESSATVQYNLVENKRTL
ncbi:hypothetical protein GYA49_01495 [Candidatus Beckwithbacteria bacterium]|nr:hypothetical protein [Candidatus Beckwithbacteria bacterium]